MEPQSYAIIASRYVAYRACLRVNMIYLRSVTVNNLCMIVILGCIFGFALLIVNLLLFS